MDYKFADRISSLKPSAIREILKFTSQPGYTPFAAGNPDNDAFPVEFVARFTTDLLKNNPNAALQYSITEGYPALRDALKNNMTKRGELREFDDIIITAGAQQVMELATKSLCNEGDTVLCENPSFIGSLNAFRSYGLKLRGVPVESDGMDLAELESALKSEKNVRFIYTIPNFQNPTGVTMSLAKRKELYALAKKYGVLILEDNPYEETRFAGESVPTIKSLDTDGIVIYAGSFSKILSPGLRVGYACAPAPVLSKMIVCKQVSDVHTNILAQMIAHGFLISDEYAPHIQKIREIYRRKATLMTDKITEFFPNDVKYFSLQGGLFLWCELPARIAAGDFCKKALDKKIAVVPGSSFMARADDECNSIRLNFSTPSDEQISAGIEILGSLLK